MVEFSSDTGFLVLAWATALQFLADWGWYIIGGLLVSFVVWSYLEPIWYNFINDNGKDVLNSLKSCNISKIKSILSGRDKVEKLMSNHDAARQRMQEAYDRKLKEKAEQKQAEASNPFAPLANTSDSVPQKKKTKKPTASEISTLLGLNQMDPPRYRPGANRYRGSRGG